LFFLIHPFNELLLFICGGKGKAMKPNGKSPAPLFFAQKLAKPA
jgi:hypothetical protein